MDDFIKQASSTTGVDEGQVKKFIGMILDYINKKVPEATVKDIESKVPGAKELVEQAKSAAVPPPGAEAEGGDAGGNDLLKPCMPVLDMLKKLIDQFTGGKATSVKEVMDVVEKSGVNPSQAAQMMEKLLEFLKEKLGPETVDQIISKIPGLSGIPK